MTDHEPYVADPQEPRPRPRLLAARPLIVGAIVLVVAAALTFLVVRDLAEQDPALQVPDAVPTAPPDGEPPEA
jgi:hypothetical protein